jgi:hypothetical protein
LFFFDDIKVCCGHAVMWSLAQWCWVFRGRDSTPGRFRLHHRRISSDTLQRFGENIEMKAIELAHALEQSRAIPLDQIASIAMDHKRNLAFVQLHTGTEVQLEASGYGDLIQKLTELYSGSYNC